MAGVIQELVTKIVADYVGEELTKEKGIELSARITQGVLMTREGLGLPEKPGRSTQCSANEKSGAIEQPNKEAEKAEEQVEEKPKRPNYPPGYTPPEERPERKTMAIVSHPYDDPTKAPEDQDGTAPIAIQKKV